MEFILIRALEAVPHYRLRLALSLTMIVPKFYPYFRPIPIYSILTKYSERIMEVNYNLELNVEWVEQG
jgi:hypothetical protein